MTERSHTGNRQLDRIQQVSASETDQKIASLSNDVTLVTRTSTMTVRHSLGKQPVGAFVIKSSDFVQMKVIKLSLSTILVEFDTADIDATVRVV